MLTNGSIQAVNADISGVLKAGNWTFNSNGAKYAYGSNYIQMLISGTTAYFKANGYAVEYGSDYSRMCHVRGYGVTLHSQSAGASVSANRYTGSYNYNDICFYCDQAGGSKDSAAGNLGTVDRIWDIGWIRYLHYFTLKAESSRAVKHDIVPLSDVGETLDKLVPVSFAYNGDSKEQVHFGLIYEDTLPVFKEICLPPEDEKDTAGIDYVSLVPILLKEIQSLRARVLALEKA